jgi:3-phenylpropionate/trans-cinnamate dioxygenase ferredoxin component
MAKKSIGLVRDLGDAPLHAVTINHKNILLAKAGKNYFAIGNLCTHDGCWLSGGRLEGDTVRCRCHGSVFNVKTGAVLHGPAEKPEPVFSVTEEEGELFIDV